MRIARIETLPAPVTAETDHILCRVTSEDGVAGIGEAYPAGPNAAVAACVAHLADWLVGQDASDINRLWYDMYQSLRFPGGSVVNAAISGIELALWDLLGKTAGLPVYQLLGGRCRDRVRVYRWVHGDSAQCAVDAKHLVEDAGITALKLTPFVDGDHLLPWRKVLDLAVERIGGVRDEVGPHVEIAVDIHGHLAEPSKALELARAIAPLGIFFLEEPLRPENVDALRDLRRRSPVPIATGEMLYTIYQFRELLSKEAADIVQPDICVCGGLGEMRRIAALAEASYIPVAPHNPLGPFGTVASLHLAASIQNFSILEYTPHDTGLRRGLVREPLTYRDGYLELPTAPGWGLELDPEGIPDRPVRDWSRARQRRPDGAADVI
jgi:galactonate dehydratase